MVSTKGNIIDLEGLDSNYTFEILFRGIRTIAHNQRLYNQEGKDISEYHTQVIKNLPKGLFCDGVIDYDEIFKIFHVFKGKIPNKYNLKEVMKFKYFDMLLNWVAQRSKYYPFNGGIIAKHKNYKYEWNIESKEWIEFKFERVIVC